MQNKKLPILIVLIIVMILVWMPKGGREQKAVPKPAPLSSEKARSATSGQRRRTEFADWGRSPFVWARVSTGTISGLRLSGIIWDEQLSYAIIDGAIVHTGDEISGKTVKRIEPNKVILTDDTQDYILQLE